MLSGPGAIAVTLGFTSLATDWTDYVAIILGILVVAGIIYSTLRVSGRIVQVIGITGMNALTKVMGFLILCIGIQFVVNGVLGIATDPTLLPASGIPSAILRLPNFSPEREPKRPQAVYRSQLREQRVLN
jgi:multiple antibiotic resistance protein